MQRYTPDSFLSINNDPCYYKCARKYSVQFLMPENGIPRLQEPSLVLTQMILN